MAPPRGVRAGIGSALVAVLLVGLATVGPSGTRIGVAGGQAPPPRTVNVTPHSALVHGQTVTVTGTGWPARGLVGAAQCRAGATELDDCELLDVFITVDPTGSFTSTQRLEVILDTENGQFDCRSETCVLGVNDTFSILGAVLVPLSFDPAGADPPRPTLNVVPDTGLLDGQEPAVTGTGFNTDDSLVLVAQCRVPTDHLEEDCDPATGLLGPTTGGDLTSFRDVDFEPARPRMASLLTLPAGPHDCRVDACQLIALNSVCEFSEAALAPLAFDPAGPATVGSPPEFGFAGRCGYRDDRDGDGGGGGGESPALPSTGPVAAAPGFTG